MECTSRQTRFHVEATNYRQIQIDGIFISFSASKQQPVSGGSSTRVKARSRSHGTEILSNAALKLKEGRQYNLVGRNGTGKSALLRAIAEKLIPGIPQDSKVAFLRQLEDSIAAPTSNSAAVITTLQQVVASVTDQNTTEKDAGRLAQIVDIPNSRECVREFRRFKLDQMHRKAELLRKEANLRSGSRGLNARKDLVSFEKELDAMETSLETLEEDETPEAAAEELQEATDFLAKLQLDFEPTDLVGLTDRARRFLLGLGFTQAMMEKPLSSLSGGWKMRASLASTLLQAADILILDEPTNFLDIFGIIWLEKHLARLQESPKPPTVVLVSHDRAFTDICTDLILLKDKTLTYFHGTRTNYEVSQSERRLWLVAMKAAQDKQVAHMEKTIAQNLKAGRDKNDQNKVRQAKSRQLRLDDRTGMQVNARGGRVKSRDVSNEYKPRDDIVIPPEERRLFISLPLPQELRFPGSLLSLEDAGYKYAAGGPNIIRNVNLTVGMVYSYSNVGR
ncbi:hypothetical protein NQ176_g6915 [Zarea fungicola]|uniref:Uncharacterized protein n=1 Tax=Zarea fungicola TaxID=93591 RepID=A0ACC1N262_9HYPO|nr:hypothetical protein NQ176_g6915 [Lecanicillium fungicola]